MTTLTIFVSSPGDVQNERAIVGKVVERLQARFWSFIRLELILWEKKALRATAHFNDVLALLSRNNSIQKMVSPSNQGQNGNLPMHLIATKNLFEKVEKMMRNQIFCSTVD